MFTVNVPLLKTILSQRYEDEVADRISDIIEYRLAEDEAWVVITPEEFNRAVKHVHLHGEHEYVNDAGEFKSKEVRGKPQMFFKKYRSKGRGPIKGWYKRIVFELKKAFNFNDEELNYIYFAINEQVEDVNHITTQPIVRKLVDRTHSSSLKKNTGQFNHTLSSKRTISRGIRQYF